MSGRAVGVRAGWEAMPPLVADVAAEILGSPVVSFADQTGGFSPGCATRVVTADGGRAFVKAVGATLNADTPTLFRREREVLELIGRHPRWADLLGALDDGDWVVLVLRDVEGVRPDLSDDATMGRFLAATEELTATLAARVPHPPAPGPPVPGKLPIHAPGLVDMRLAFADWLDAIDRVHEMPVGLLPRWLVNRRDELRPGVAALLNEPIDRLLHWDVRDDNLLQRVDGSIVFVDWGAAAVGPGWLDPLLARLERVHLPWFDASLAGSPTLREVGDAVVTSWLVGLGASQAWRAHTRVEVGLPTMKAFRLAESARFLDAAARRLGIPRD